MSPESLPAFRYHPDPIATGSVVRSDRVCRCCGSARGLIYVGPTYAEADLDNGLCPWCIADGTAHEKFNASFTDPDRVGGTESWPAVPAAVVEAVAFRTPGFQGWQEERWFTCCGDAGAFLGPKGRLDLEDAGEEALTAIRLECGHQGDAWQEYLDALNRDFGPTAYLFRCLHCGRLGGYSDFA
jgi:uncharacterized protein CbrC (UPF0167 family)